MTTVAEVPVDRRLNPPETPTLTMGWWGMAILCATEGALFAYLIGSYAYLGAIDPRWPPAGIEPPKLDLPIVMTILLAASSALLTYGSRELKANRRTNFRIGTGLALVAGLAFLVVQSIEYHDKLEHFRPSDHAYASLFYTITGFHGLHVALGLLVLGWLIARESVAATVEESRRIVEVGSLYWHFVGVVWLAIFVSLYLTPHFS